MCIGGAVVCGAQRLVGKFPYPTSFGLAVGVVGHGGRLLILHSFLIPLCLVHMIVWCVPGGYAHPGGGGLYRRYLRALGWYMDRRSLG